MYSEHAQRFLTALNEALRSEDVFRGVAVRCDERAAGTMEMRGLQVAGGRGRGRGTAALRRLCEIADEAGVALYAQPHSADPVLAERLRGWYLREGFSVETEPGRLVRPPRPAAVPTP